MADPQTDQVQGVPAGLQAVPVTSAEPEVKGVPAGVQAVPRPTGTVQGVPPGLQEQQLATPTPPPPPSGIGKVWQWANDGLISKDTLVRAMTGQTSEQLDQSLKADPNDRSAIVHVPGLGDWDVRELVRGSIQDLAQVASSFTSPLSLLTIGGGEVLASVGASARAATAVRAMKSAETAAKMADAAYTTRLAEASVAARDAENANQAWLSAKYMEETGQGTHEAALAAQRTASEAAANATRTEQAYTEARDLRAAHLTRFEQAARDMTDAIKATKTVPGRIVGNVSDTSKLAKAGKYAERAVGTVFTEQAAQSALEGRQEGESLPEEIERRFQGAGFALLGGAETARTAGDFAKNFKEWHDARAGVKETADAKAQKSDFKQAIPPGTGVAYYGDEDFDRALPYLESHHVNPNTENVNTVTDVKEAAEYERQALETKVSAIVQKYKNEPIAKNVKQHVMEQMKPLEAVKAGTMDAAMDTLSQYNLTDPTMGEADRIRVQLNNENRGILKKNSWDVSTALATDPEFAARYYAAEALRDGIYDKLEERRVTGAREMRQDESSLIKIRNAADRVENKGEAIKRGTSPAGPVRRILAKTAGAVVGGGVGELAGHLIGSATGIPGVGEALGIGGLFAGKAIADKIAPQDLTRDQLVARAFTKKTSPNQPLELDTTNAQPSNPEAIGLPPHATPIGPEQAAAAPAPHPDERSTLHAELAAHYGRSINPESKLYTPFEDLLNKLESDIEIKERHGVSATDLAPERKLLAKANLADAQREIETREAAKQQVEEAKKEALKAAEEKKKTDQENGALTAHIANPFEPGEEMPISKRWQSLVEGISGPRIRAHELGHHIMAALANWLTGDVIGENHPKLSGGKNSLAEARWDDHPFYDEKGNLDLGKVTDNLDQLLDLFHGGAIAEEIVHGVPMAENYGATGDLSKMRGLLKDGLKMQPAEIGAAMKASELRVRKVMSTPGVRDIIDRYTKSREAGLRDDVHMSDETVAKAVEEVKTLLGGGNNGTNNEGKAANGLRGGAEKGEARGVGGNASKSEGEAGAAREKGASAGGARRGTERVGGVTEKTKANIAAEPEMKVEHRDNAMGGDVRLEGPEGNHGYLAYTTEGPHSQVQVSMVEKGQRGKGYGQQMYETIADKVRAKGGERLHSDPEETSPDAARVWEKLSAKHPGEITKGPDGRYTWDLKANIGEDLPKNEKDTFGNGGWYHEGEMHPIKEAKDTHLTVAQKLGLTQSRDFEDGIREATENGGIRIKPEFTKGYNELNLQAGINNEGTRGQLRDILDKYETHGQGKTPIRVQFLNGQTEEFGNVAEAREWMDNPRRSLKANLGHEAMAGLKASRESEQAAEKENTDKQIAAHEANGGSTFTPQGENLAGKDLYAVGSYPERGRVVDTLTPEALNKFKADNADLLAKGDHAVGSWKDPETGKVALDISKTYADRDEAIAAGKAANQKAIYHLGTGETVNTGGTGENPNEMLKANIGGPLSDDPTQFRKQIEAVSKGDLEPAEMHDIYELMRKEAARNLARAKANRQNWHSDYWSGNLKKINAAIRELGPRESSGGPSLKANIAAEPKEEEGFNFGKNAEGTPDQQKGLISTALPKGKKAIADPLETDVRVGMESLTPKSEAAIADKIREMPGFRIPDAIKDPKKVIAKYIDQFKKNLIDVHNRVDPETRAATAKWYESANGIARRTAEKFGKTLKQGAGILAALSPQKDWDQNVSLAERVNDIYHTKGDMRMTPEMRAKVDQLVGEKHTDEEGNVTRKNDKLGNLVDSIGDRTFNELSNPLEKAAFIRLYDEAHNPREFHRIDPGTGNRAEIVTTDSGAPRRIAWGSLNEISKAVSILEDGSRENISNNLGGSHKVRNFYNNILDPNNPAGHVTVDTHAVAAGHQRMLGGNSPEVAANFGGISAAETGLKGMYAVNAEAYRQAAKELGLQPRQLQSIVWEEIRKQFPDEYKRSKPAQAAIDGIWKEYEDGDITLKNAQQRVRDYAQKGYAEMVANKPAAKAAAKPQVKPQTNWDWEKIGLLPSNFVKSGK